LASPSVFIAAAAAAAAAAFKSSASTLDQQEVSARLQAQAPGTPGEVDSPAPAVAPNAAVTAGGLVPPLLSTAGHHHPLLPTLGFTIEQVRVRTSFDARTSRNP